jgi:hypothetical protein
VSIPRHIVNRVERLEQRRKADELPATIVNVIVEPGPNGPIDTGERVIWERKADGPIRPWTEFERSL